MTHKYMTKRSPVACAHCGQEYQVLEWAVTVPWYCSAPNCVAVAIRMRP